MSVLSDLPLTRFRIAAARLAYLMLRPVIGSKPRVVERQGIRYELTPAEGIDFGLYLFGSFQSHVTDTAYVKLPDDAVMMDVGANVGAVALRLSAGAPRGELHAFEPSDATFARLARNVRLNPKLAARIKLTKAFVSDVRKGAVDTSVYARWPLTPTGSAAKHPVHGGVLETVTATPTVTLDEYVEEHRLTRVDFIKIDTDGHELAVLRGATRTLERLRPIIVFEAGAYLLAEKRTEFAEFLRFFPPLRYDLVDLKTGQAVTPSNYERLIPRRSTTDVLARPVKASRG